MTASKLKEQCLARLDPLGPADVAITKRGITKRGKPVAKRVFCRASQAALIGSLAAGGPPQAMRRAGGSRHLAAGAARAARGTA